VRAHGADFSSSVMIKKLFLWRALAALRHAGAQ
jgi:hypothetical protein